MYRGKRRFPSQSPTLLSAHQRFSLLRYSTLLWHAAGRMFPKNVLTRIVKCSVCTASHIGVTTPALLQGNRFPTSFDPWIAETIDR